MPKEKLPAWMQPESQFFLVPLQWRRDLGLPPAHGLEAWIAWSGDAPKDAWDVDPSGIYKSEATSGEEFFLRQLIFAASIDVDTRSNRLSCAKLLKPLSQKSNSQLWLASEPDSISIWTDVAFQTWFGRLGQV